MTTLILIVAALALAIGVAWRVIKGLDSKGKTAIKDAVNGVFESAEARGAFPRQPAFETDYAETYPHFRLIEENYDTIREECEALMKDRSGLVPMESLGGGYTAGKTPVAEWTPLMFKSGQFVEEN